MKRIETCLNVQSKVPTDPTVKNFGMQIKGQMMEVKSQSPYTVTCLATGVVASDRPALLVSLLHAYFSSGMHLHIMLHEMYLPQQLRLPETLHAWIERHAGRKWST